MRRAVPRKIGEAVGSLWFECEIQAPDDKELDDDDEGEQHGATFGHCALPCTDRFSSSTAGFWSDDEGHEDFNSVGIQSTASNLISM